MSNTLLQKEVFLSNERANASDARAKASEAHCTILKHVLLAAKKELLSKKSKGCCAVKTSACYVAYNTVKELHVKTHYFYQEQWAMTRALR